MRSALPVRTVSITAHPARPGRSRRKARGKTTTLRPRMRIDGPSERRRLAGLGAAALVTAALGWSLGVAQDRRESEAALSAVRKEIKELQQRVARETTRRDERARDLRAAEVEIAAATQKLAAVRKDLGAQQTARRELTRETQSADRRLAAEREAL